MKCEYGKCKAPVVQTVRKLWDGGTIHLCAGHAMNDANADGMVPNRHGFPVSYQVVEDRR